MKQAFIFGAGSFYGLQTTPSPGDYIVAADGGYRTCQALGIVPTVVVGDFDSMEKPTAFPHVLQAPVEKDDTDTMLAIKMALEQGCETIHLYGVTGGKRLDHTLAALQSLLYICRHGSKGFAYDDDFVFTAIEHASITLEPLVHWGLLSIFALDGTATGVTISGAQYTLENGQLTADISLGVSNHFLDAPATISVRDGALLVGWELPSRDA